MPAGRGPFSCITHVTGSHCSTRDKFYYPTGKVASPYLCQVGLNRTCPMMRLRAVYSRAVLRAPAFRFSP
jgi:hypothetical protein